MRSSLDETFGLTDQDLLDKERGRRFLDFYGDDGLREALERYGILDAVRERGWHDLTIEAVVHDDRHTLLVEGRSDNETGRLVELVVRRDRLHIDSLDGHPSPDRIFDVLVVDWLSLRNPRAQFTRERMRLPGQDAPGLGMGEQVLELLYRVVDRLTLEGLVTVAEYFHNAVLYARELPFVDPWHQGRLRALEKLLLEQEKLSFAQAAWAMHWGYVLDVDDSVVRWRGEAMMHSKHPELLAYLTCGEYARIAERTLSSLRYRLHRAAFEEAWAVHEAALFSPPTGIESDPDDHRRG
jgi:hypothetical protein